VEDVVDDATLQNFMLLLLYLFTELVSFAVEKERFAQLLHNLSYLQAVVTIGFQHMGGSPERESRSGDVWSRVLLNSFCRNAKS
jgi:hypothetical protein